MESRKVLIFTLLLVIQFNFQEIKDAEWAEE